MIIADLRSRRYHGGCRWLSSGVLGVYVGLVAPVAVIEPDQIFISNDALCVARVVSEAAVGATVSAEILIVARVVNEALADAE